jgi:hypothetical protein
VAASWEEAWEPFQPLPEFTTRKMNPQIVASSGKLVTVLWHQRGIFPLLFLCGMPLGLFSLMVFNRWRLCHELRELAWQHRHPSLRRRDVISQRPPSSFAHVKKLAAIVVALGFLFWLWFGVSTHYAPRASYPYYVLLDRVLGHGPFRQSQRSCFVAQAHID